MAISLIRTILLYILIIFALKVMGKRQISDLQTSELVVTLLISNIAAIPMQNTGQPLVSGVVPIVVLIFLEVAISMFMLKSSKFRKLICGSPVVIINNGKIQQRELKALRMTIDDLLEELRQLDIFAIEDVQFAVVETNGKVSVLKKSDKEPPDASTLGVVTPESGVEMVVVSDGEISDFALSVCDLSREWVEKIVKSQNIKLSEIFIMTADKDKKYNIIRKEIS